MATDAKETKHDTHLEVTVSKGTERRRQGKFQPFKRLFGKRKKREVVRGFDAVELKASYSTGEVCNGVVSDDEDTNQNLRELNPIGSRALSHDSIFIPEEPVPEPCLEQTMSQENVSDKVRNLQRQIAQSIKFGQKPPSQRRSEGDEGSSDEEEVPQSPLKVEAQMEAAPPEPQPKEVQVVQQPQGAQQHVHVTQQAKGAQQVQAPAQQGTGTGTHSTPVRSPRSRRVLPPDGTIESINLDSVPLSAPRLDNTAAKHKLAVKPKNQRVSRKHRRFTRDLHEVSLPGVLQEEQEAEGGQQRTAAEEPPYGSPETSKKQRLQEEERRESRQRREQEEQRLRREEEEERRRRAEELRARELEEERCRKQQEEERLCKEEEERRQREEAERMRREEEERMRREEEERRRQEELEHRRREEEEEARKRQEEEERRRREEEERKRLEEQRRKEEEEERRRLELEGKRLREEEERQRRLKEEMEEKMKLEAEERRKLEEEELKPPQERKRRAEELRWREMEERQRPFSFKVSSGEKQILFQKVNLTPVAGHHSGPAAETAEGVKTSSSEGGDSHLPSSQYVPHTAILVTGAQLCGTAVHMDQIKDTACKSLLGLGEDKRAMGLPLAKGKISPDRKSAKTKSLTETSPATDQSSAAVLAEWASIRSKIFKGAEEGKYDDHPESGRNQTRPSSEDLNQPPFSHTNLRKTMSANAKFSITPAKKKFGDSNRNSELLSLDVRDGGKDVSTPEAPCSSPSASPGPGGRAQSKAAKTVRIAERGPEECVFAKDLPSFLVPSPGSKAEAAEVKNGSQGEADDSDYNEEEEEERGSEGGEDKPSPFGIKLRRTNYSLRFHSEQSTEKRKKRYSAGDSFDGVPSPLTPIEPDSDCSSVFSDKSSPVSPHPESAGSRFSHAAASPAVLRAKSGRSQSAAAMHGEGEKALSKPPLYQRPTVSPKPATPPPSPLPKTVRGVSSDATTQRAGGPAESPGQDQAERGEDSSSAVAQLRRSSHVPGDEEPKEKKSFFPSINIPWREKTDRKTELLRKEKPSLQSRHSLDSSRASEKEVGPLWITLALQKQKGFREQQQSRDDRRSQREAKLAEKQSRDKDGATLGSPTDSKVDRSPSPSKPRTPEAPKRPDSLLGRFDRRDPLKKANTLPSSVTVEIADSTPSPPSVKEVSKRFPSTDSPHGSTEPAWLALAKRKAKAWSDCPQIIK